MLVLALLAQMAAMDMSGRIDVSGQHRVVIPPRQHDHHAVIGVDELAKSTIAYCERTGQTMCVNGVSSLSGGATVNVCKVNGVWLVNQCASRRKQTRA